MKKLKLVVIVVVMLALVLAAGMPTGTALAKVYDKPPGTPHVVCYDGLKSGRVVCHFRGEWWWSGEKRVLPE